MKSSSASLPGSGSRQRLRNLLSLLKGSFSNHKARLLLGFLALLLVDFLQLTIPRFIKYGVDSLAAGEIDETGLLLLGGTIVGIGGAVVGLRFCWRYLIIGFSRILELDIRNTLFHHILRLDAPFFSRTTTGDIMAHFTNDLSAIQMACGMGMVAAIDALVMSTAAIGFMLAINPTLAVLALLPMPILIVSTKILSGKLHQRFSTVQELFSAMTEFSRTTLLSIGLIKANTMEKLQSTRFDSFGRKYIRANLRVAAIQGLISPMASMVGSLGMLVVLLFGGRLVIERTISIGDFVAFITYLYMLIWPMMAIGWVTNLVQRGLTSLNRIHKIIGARPVLVSPPTAKPLPREGMAKSKPAVFTLQSLSFSYPDSKIPALDRIDLRIGREILGITGRTGSGKSTLCKVLARLYPVADGQLMFRGIDVNELALDELRNQIGYVAQEPTLFSETIEENIRLGNPESTLEEVRRAAKLAGVHNDIMDFPERYETVIGERGLKLSGGQRQRVTLARALLCNRPVLIIDDGLSAVDVETEHEVFDNLKQVFKDKTVIIVSNRMKLLSITDRILILDQGRISQTGNHQELLGTSRFYTLMYEKQMAEESDTGARL